MKTGRSLDIGKVTYYQDQLILISQHSLRGALGTYILVHLTGKDTLTVIQAMKREMIKLPEHLRRSIIWDRGPEIAAHNLLSIALDLDIYICDPQSPWQR